MNCIRCDGRTRVQSTSHWEGEIWRSRRCLDCDSTQISQEVTRPAWPEGMWQGKKLGAATKAQALAAKAGRVGRIRVEGPKDAFDPNAGADLAGVMWSFAKHTVAPTQQRDPD